MDGIDATILSNAQLGQEIGIALAVKAQNVAKDQGQAALALLEQAAQIQQQTSLEAHLGKRLDVRG